MSVKSSQHRSPLIFSGYALMALLAFIFILPFFFMLASSLKTNNQIFADTESMRAFLPTGEISLDNYDRVFKESGIGKYLLNSVIITVLTVGLGLIVNSMAAFALARLEWRGKKFVLALLVILIIVPFEAIAVPMMLMVAELPFPAWGQNGPYIRGSWLDTHHVQIFPFVTKALFIFLFYQFFKGIPKDFDEAAYIDGATPLQVYRHVIVPLSWPVFATAAILHTLEMWNQYLWPVITVPGEEARPLMIGMQQFFRQEVVWGEVMAYATVITIPILVLFIFFQRGFVRSVMGSGVKG